MSAEEILDPCPTCGRAESGFGACAAEVARVRAGLSVEGVDEDDDRQPSECPCCDECRKRCAEEA